jgi:hypothetical protein
MFRHGSMPGGCQFGEKAVLAGRTPYVVRKTCSGRGVKNFLAVCEFFAAVDRRILRERVEDEFFYHRWIGLTRMREELGGWFSTGGKESMILNRTP